jgi:regulator of chromosome condensation
MDRRGKMHSLTPALLLRKDVVGIGAGAFHSFAVRKDGQVLGWGLNSFGQAGVAAGGAGENNASVVAPSVVPALSRVPPRRGRTAAAQTTTAHLPAAASANDDGAAAAAATANAATASSPSAPSAPVAANATDPAASSAPASASASVAVAAGPTTDATANDVAPGAQQQQQQQQPRQQQQRYGLVTGITGGNNHSIALTDKGECLVWGRLDNFACGLQLGALPADDGEGGRLVVHDERGRPRILLAPTPVPGLGTVVHVAAGSDHSLAVAADGRAHAWGFNAEGQCGHGRELDEVETATPINNTAVRGKRLVWAGAGGQYSVLAGLAEQEQQEQQG